MFIFASREKLIYNGKCYANVIADVVARKAVPTNPALSMSSVISISVPKRDSLE
jgi:hypothetical protein